MARGLVCSLVVACICGLAARESKACKPSPSGSPHSTDPTLQATDSEAPVLPPIGEATAYRGSEVETGCLGLANAKCGGDGSIHLPAPATDDRSPPDRIGYRVSVVDGQPPHGLQLPITHRPFGDLLVLRWPDGGPDDHEPFDVTLEVVAVDEAGNESAPQTIRVSDPGSGGCRIARAHMSRDPAIPAIVLGIMAVLGRRRDRKRRAAR